jgi:hypothetical protein
LNYCKGFRKSRDKQGTAAGKRKHIGLKILQKLEIICRLESGKS